MPIAESEGFLHTDMVRTSSESRDVHIAVACVDATFESAFDAIHCRLVEVRMAFVHQLRV